MACGQASSNLKLRPSLRKVSVGKESNAPWTAHYYRKAGKSAPIYALPMNSVWLGVKVLGAIAEKAGMCRMQGVFAEQTKRKPLRVRMME